MNDKELREFCSQMIGKFKALSELQTEMQYETIDTKFTEWELKKLIFALDTLRIKAEQADTPQTECRTCKWAKVSWTSHYCDDCKAHNKYEPNDTPQTEEPKWTKENCKGCKYNEYPYDDGTCFVRVCIDGNKYEPKQTDCSTCKFDDAEWYVNNCDECVCGNGKPSNYVPKQTDCP